MDERPDFATILRRCMAQARRGPTDLEHLTGISARTIENWAAGVVRRPRELRDLLKVARALGLDAPDATALLSAAGYPPLATLGDQAQRADDGELLALLAAWPPAVPAAGPTRRAQLRAPVADFVGRGDAISTLVTTLRRPAVGGAVAAISGVRGMGGIGKTELAYLVAHHVADAYPDAQIVVNLRGTSPTPLTAEQALQQIIQAFAPDEQLPADLDALQQRARTVLHGQRVLILADDACDAAQVRSLLPPPGCALLVTSRQRFTLPGMATVDLEQLQEEEAVGLLQSICPRLRADEARAIARACTYLPLALRVSASILHNDPALPVAEYMERLADERQRLAQLRDPDDGQLDVEASLALSYARLDTAAQRAFRQLGVLAADFATGLALTVVEVEVEQDIAALLHRLLRRNLVMYDAGRQRWRLHDLLRDLARHQLEAAGEHEAVMWHYAQAAVQMVQALHAQYLAGGGAALAALARFDAERPHIDAARRWAAAHAGTPEGDALLLVDALAITFELGSLRYDPRRERIPHLEAALSAARRLGDRNGEGTVLNRLGSSYLYLGDASGALDYYEQRLAIAQEIGDQVGESQVLNNLGSAYLNLGDPRRAIQYYERNLAIAPAIGARRSEASSLSNLGMAYLDLGEAQRALPALEQAFRIKCTLGDQRGQGVILGSLGDAYLALGHGRRAMACFEEQLAIFRALKDLYGEGIALHKLGRACLALAEDQRAIDHCARALDLLQEAGDQRMEGYALTALGASCAAAGDHPGARAAFEAALKQLRAAGDRFGEAVSSWDYGLFLARQGECEHALPLLRACVAYEEEIGHAKAAEHAALLAELELRKAAPPE